MLELKQITAGYPGRPVLEDVTVRLAPGELTGIIGVNGCGKSTLLKTALGLLPPTRGSVALDGAPLGQMTRTQIARRVAYLAQGKNTPDMTVEQMVLHGRFPHLSYPRRYSSRDRAIALQAMERAGVADCARMPLYTLSGGMRQKAYIAMALAQNTDYILLDEPTTYLDISHQLSLMRTLEGLARDGRGVAVVLHDLPLAFTFSHRLVLLDRGRVAAQGAPEDPGLHQAVSQVFGVTLVPCGDGRSYRYQY